MKKLLIIPLVILVALLGFSAQSPSTDRPVNFAATAVPFDSTMVEQEVKRETRVKPIPAEEDYLGMTGRDLKEEADRLAAEAAAKKKPSKVFKQKKRRPKATRSRTVAPKPARVTGIAACIAKYESGGNPTAQNPTSSASGLYQFIDGTWAGYGGYSRAMHAPVSVQTAKFYQVWDNGRGARNWVVAHKCGY